MKKLLSKAFMFVMGGFKTLGYIVAELCTLILGGAMVIVGLIFALLPFIAALLVVLCALKFLGVAL